MEKRHYCLTGDNLGLPRFSVDPEERKEDSIPAKYRLYHETYITLAHESHDLFHYLSSYTELHEYLVEIKNALIRSQQDISTDYTQYHLVLHLETNGTKEFPISETVYNKLRGDWQVHHKLVRLTCRARILDKIDFELHSYKEHLLGFNHCTMNGSVEILTDANVNFLFQKLLPRVPVVKINGMFSTSQLCSLDKAPTIQTNKTSS